MSPFEYPEPLEKEAISETLRCSQSLAFSYIYMISNEELLTPLFFTNL